MGVKSYNAGFWQHRAPRVVGFRCRILDNGLFILNLSGSCGSVMTHLSPTGEWFTHSSLLSHSNSPCHTKGGAKTLTIKRLNNVYSNCSDYQSTLCLVISTFWIFDYNILDMLNQTWTYWCPLFWKRSSLRFSNGIIMNTWNMTMCLFLNSVFIYSFYQFLCETNTFTLISFSNK